MAVASPDLLLPPLPLLSLERGDAEELHRRGVVRTPIALGLLVEQSDRAVVTSACRVPAGAGEGLVVRALGIGDRRDVLLGADQPLGRLASGSEIVAPDLRTTALLRAHHPTLVPRPGHPPVRDGSGRPGADDRLPEIRSLWRDPGVESVGELLEPESWLPAPGQGVAVLVHAPEAKARFAGVPEDPDAAAVLRAERVVEEAFSFAVPLVRAQLFGQWLSIHAIVLTPGGDRAVRARVRGDREDPAGVAERLVGVLLDRGGALLRPGGPEEGRQTGAPAR